MKSALKPSIPENNKRFMKINKTGLKNEFKLNYKKNKRSSKN